MSEGMPTVHLEWEEWEALRRDVDHARAACAEWRVWYDGRPKMTGNNDASEVVTEAAWRQNAPARSSDPGRELLERHAKLERDRDLAERDLARLREENERLRRIIDDGRQFAAPARFCGQHGGALPCGKCDDVLYIGPEPGSSVWPGVCLLVFCGALLWTIYVHSCTS